MEWLGDEYYGRLNIGGVSSEEALPFKLPQTSLITENYVVGRKAQHMFSFNTVKGSQLEIRSQRTARACRTARIRIVGDCLIFPNGTTTPDCNFIAYVAPCQSEPDMLLARCSMQRTYKYRSSRTSTEVAWRKEAQEPRDQKGLKLSNSGLCQIIRDFPKTTKVHQAWLRLPVPRLLPRLPQQLLLVGPTLRMLPVLFLRRFPPWVKGVFAAA